MGIHGFRKFFYGPGNEVGLTAWGNGQLIGSDMFQCIDQLADGDEIDIQCWLTNRLLPAV